MSDEQRDELIERAMRGVRGLETHTPHGYDPASDDMTVEFAIKLSEQDAEIATLRTALDRAETEKAELQNRFSEGCTQLMAEIAKAQAAMCQKALYKSERDALRAELAIARDEVSRSKVIEGNQCVEIAELSTELAAMHLERDIALNTFKREFDRAESANAELAAVREALESASKPTSERPIDRNAGRSSGEESK